MSANPTRFLLLISNLVDWLSLLESMGSIISRTSLLDPDVRISTHPAPDVLGFSLAHVDIVVT
nr:hypothetical protein [Brasilonema angustatum HA4187-MV1]